MDICERERAQSFTQKHDLKYIQIERKNKIIKLSTDRQITEASNFLITLTPMEENLGGEINNFFMKVLPENKEREILKILTVISNKTKINKNILNSYLTNILNRPEEDKITLTRDLSEEISVILREIFKKIKKKTKIKNYEELKKKAENYMDNLHKEDILSYFRVENSSKTLGSGFNLFENVNNNDENIKRLNDEIYEYKEIKLPKDIQLPLEMLILIRKFNLTKTLRLTINSDYYSISDNFSKSYEYSNDRKKNDLENIILILFNLDWLFPSLVGLELDFSNSDLLESQINLYKYTLDVFSKLVKKETKITTYQKFDYNNKRNSEPLYKSVFSQFSYIDEVESSFDRMSTSNISNNHIYLGPDTDYSEVIFSEEKYNKTFDKFIEKYTNIMEMMIIYSYFIGKMKSVINAKFIFPLNVGEEIIEFLRQKDIFINDFHILSFFTKNELIDLSIEFNSLDSQIFEKILNFLNQNTFLCKLNMSFFPEEEFFKTELLLNLLQSSNDNFKLRRDKNNKLGFKSNINLDTKANESLDEIILRKLSENFEKNMQNFFYLLTMKSNINELVLTFDIPTIMIKNDYYNNIIMKFILDLFIMIDSSLNNNIIQLSLIAENFIFDSRKNPILIDLFDKINLFNKESHKLKILILNLKIYRIPQIYRFISYNLIYLSIGSLDFETFNNLVNYLTSANFGMKSNLTQLKISLNNSLIDFNEQKLYEILLRLFTEYPKRLTELSLYSFLLIPYEQLISLLKKTDYNTLTYLFLQLSIKSFITKRSPDEKFEYDTTSETRNMNLKIDNLLKLYTIKRNNDLSNIIVNLLMNLGKINGNIFNYAIFEKIEKFLCPKELKKVIIEFK